MRRPARSLLLALLPATLALAVLLANWPSPDARPVPGLQASAIGEDRGRGNLLGVQPWLQPADYASAARLQARLEGWLREAAARGWLGERTIVVFPEHIGTWLVAADESGLVHRAGTLGAAMPWIALRHPIAVARAWRDAGEADRLVAALFRARAAPMADAYQQVFANLARAHRVTIVAGSIVLPEPRIADGRVRPGTGALYNTGAVFSPAGDAQALVRKLYPIASELPFTARGAPAALRTVDTPAGRLGVLVCADAWYPDAWAALRRQGVDVVAVPSFAAGDGLWEAPWAGYNGAAAPPDVDPADIGRIDEAAAWLRYAMAGRLPGSGARAGINVFLRGQLWDLGDDGATISAAAAVQVDARRDGPTLTNLWIP